MNFLSERALTVNRFYGLRRVCVFSSHSETNTPTVSVVSSLELVWFCGVRPRTNHRLLLLQEQLVYFSISNWRVHHSGTHVVHYEMHESVAAHKHPLQSSQHEQDHYHCVLYDQTGSQWTAVTDAAMLHIARDTVPIYRHAAIYNDVSRKTPWTSPVSSPPNLDDTCTLTLTLAIEVGVESQCRKMKRSFLSGDRQW